MAIAAIPLFLILAVVAAKGCSVIDLHLFTHDTLPFRLEGGGFRQGFVGLFVYAVLVIGTIAARFIAARFARRREGM